MTTNETNTPTTLPAQADSTARMVMLTYGRMEDGTGTYWCYVAVLPSQYDRFMHILKEGSLNLHRFAEDGFGEVLVSGPGLYPPQEITQQIAKLYNTPIRDLFGNMDPKSAISQKIEQLIKNNPTA